MNIKIRVSQNKDTRAIGQLIADTYARYNLDFLPPDEQGPFLGPFRHAYSNEKNHQEEIARIIQAPVLLVAENKGGEIVGVLRGSAGRLHSLFVRGDHHHQGIGRMLVEKFEKQCRKQGDQKITLAAALYAVPFYQRIGYKKSTGVRSGRSFQGEGFQYQPMKKVLE